MAKATLTLESGAVVTIEGTTKEVHELLHLHSSGPHTASASRAKVTKRKADKESAPADRTGVDPVPEIVNLIKSCDEAEQIEEEILDKSSATNRCLLPL